MATITIIGDDDRKKRVTLEGRGTLTLELSKNVQVNVDVRRGKQVLSIHPGVVAAVRFTPKTRLKLTGAADFDALKGRLRARGTARVDVRGFGSFTVEADPDAVSVKIKVRL